MDDGHNDANYYTIHKLIFEVLEDSQVRVFIYTTRKAMGSFFVFLSLMLAGRCVVSVMSDSVFMNYQWEFSEARMEWVYSVCQDLPNPGIEL